MFHSVEFSILLSLLPLTCYSFHSRCLFFAIIPCRSFQLFFHTNCVSWFLFLILGVCDDLHIFVSFLRTFWPPYWYFFHFGNLLLFCHYFTFHRNLNCYTHIVISAFFYSTNNQIASHTYCHLLHMFLFNFLNCPKNDNIPTINVYFYSSKFVR